MPCPGVSGNEREQKAQKHLGKSQRTWVCIQSSFQERPHLIGQSCSSMMVEWESSDAWLRCLDYMENILTFLCPQRLPWEGFPKALVSCRKDAISRCDVDSICWRLWNRSNVSGKSSTGQHPQQKSAGMGANRLDDSFLVPWHIQVFLEFRSYHRKKRRKGRTLIWMLEFWIWLWNNWTELSFPRKWL